ncbi:MAG: nitric oxide reductase activation protein NorD [Thermodesulfobacteriota bacterium]
MEEGLVARLQRIIPDHELNSWERDELLAQLAGYAPPREEAVLAQIGVLWPVSHSLCFAFLEQLDAGLSCLDDSQLPEWVKGILAAYEADGLRAARLYMADVENNFLCRLRGENGLTLAEAKGRLTPYLDGLAGKNIQIEAADYAGTDSSTLFLPREITLYQERDDNFLVFKLLASLQWALLRNDLYCQRHDTGGLLAGHLTCGKALAEEANGLALFLDRFADQPLAADLYYLLQTGRAAFFLQSHLPGLMRDARPFFARQRQELSGSRVPAGAATVLHEVRLWLLATLSGDEPAVSSGVAERIVAGFAAEQRGSQDVFTLTAECYGQLATGAGRYAPLPSLFFAGQLQVEVAHRARLARREEVKQKFIEGLAAILLPQWKKREEGTDESPEAQLAAANVLESGANVSPIQSQKNREEEGDAQQGEPRFLCLDDEGLELPEEIRNLAREIVDDLGGVPAFYIASARMQAGGRSRTPLTAVEGASGNGLSDGLLYDEWDYRRQGFRKNWCRLIRKKLDPVRGTFVSNTLTTYRGQIVQLKRQFEMMRTSQRFVKRQRDGDEIDIDALTEASVDLRAGRTPSERLFVRLLRDERDIAALFLVDMSSSTEGWVGTALKESLVLLCEALESLGDRYAIHGFSGMRRTRSEIYHVKGFSEPYSEEIQGRIAALAPIDYTRMGPPIRHFTREMARVDAKVRLLILLTDGKPEDYDDYKGEYAIEDTRHALIEAKTAGIHPFCITIDREAQDYMAHLFGRINYIFIDDVRKLPLRVPEIYRTITA